MANRDVLVTEGAFSKLTITLNDDMMNRLALMERKDNPLAKVEQKLKKVLYQFEKEYFKAVK